MLINSRLNMLNAMLVYSRLHKQRRIHIFYLSQETLDPIYRWIVAWLPISQFQYSTLSGKVPTST